MVAEDGGGGRRRLPIIVGGSVAVVLMGVLSAVPVVLFAFRGGTWKSPLLSSDDGDVEVRRNATTTTTAFLDAAVAAVATNATTAIKRHVRGIQLK